jgi:uncharacterized OB-fold protein
MGQKPIAEGLFTWPSEDPRLIGSRCTKCGVTNFPAQSSCSACFSEQTEEVELEPRGPLWTFTTQEFSPKDPYKGPKGADWKPYGVGYIELGGAVRVESPLTVNDPAQLEIGMEMELKILPLYTDAEGDEVMAFAFAPVATEN